MIGTYGPLVFLLGSSRNKLCDLNLEAFWFHCIALEVKD